MCHGVSTQMSLSAAQGLGKFYRNRRSLSGNCPIAEAGVLEWASVNPSTCVPHEKYIRQRLEQLCARTLLETCGHRLPESLMKMMMR